MLMFSAYNESLPLCHQWKRYLSIWGFSPWLNCLLYGASSCTSKTYNISIQKHSFWSRNNSDSLAKILKFFHGSGFVKMSATCSFVPTYSTLMFFSATCSYRKWYLIGMCFVLECITGFFEILIALALSQYIGMGSSYSTYIYVKVCFIHRTCVQRCSIIFLS